MPGARILEGERLTFRTVEQEDTPFIQRTFTNPAIRYPTGNPVRSQEQIAGAEDDGSDQFLVCRDRADVGPAAPAEDDVRRIGWVGASDMEYKRPEIGYWLIPAVHGEGYGKEAVSLLVDYVFREYNTPAVGAVAYDFNEASRGLLTSLGFVEEGRRRKFMFVDGEHRDMIEYGLLREEWETQKRET
ncbi:GNAT family N-acetyltransferase [Halovenus rubra]|uniref:GNAT family N-acetyltransferase n=2 Tax=Halovenus rubra TaxID=869890 RepID=A0ABD5X3C1_9EURY|nr:GNAT family protein [Halovenus rubra]